MSKYRLSDGIPAGVWYGLSIVALTYYAAFHSAGRMLAVFSVAYWILVGAFLYCYSRVQPFDLFSPVVGLIVLLFLYSLASGLFVAQFGVLYFGDPIDDLTLSTYYLCCLVGLAGLATGALLGSTGSQTVDPDAGREFSVENAHRNRAFERRLVFWAAVLGVGLAPFVIPQFNFLHVASYAERALALRVERAGVATAGLKETLLEQLPATYILCAATLLMLKPRRKWVRFLGLSIFLAYVAANTLAGWRGAVVAALVIPVVYYHYRVRRLSTSLALVSALVVYVFVNALSVVRSTSNPIEMATTLRDNVGANGLAFASLSGSGELAVGQNLMRLISGVHAGETSFTYGESVVSDLLVFVPRAFFPNRPLPLSERFVDVFYPGVRESGGGYGFFILQDGYWAFGVPGVFLLMLVYGWAVQRLYLSFGKYFGSDFGVLAYSSLYAAIVIAAVRTGTVASFKGAIINLLPMMVLWGLTKISLPRFRNGRLAVEAPAT